MKRIIMMLMLTVFTVNVFGATLVVPKRNLGVDCQAKLTEIKKFETEIKNPNKDYDNAIAQMLRQSAIENYEKNCGVYEGK